MGIFFDHDWFDARLRSAGLTRAALAQAAGMTIDELEMVFNDRRELEGGEVHAFARVLAADPREVANRSGIADVNDLGPPPSISTMGSVRGPMAAAPAPAVTREMIAGIHERLDRLERMLEMVLGKLDRR